MAHPNQPHPSLTPEQTRAAHMMAVLCLTHSLEEAAAQIGVSRKTLWRWRCIPEFRDLVARRSTDGLKAEIGRANRGLMGGVDKGNPKCLELYYKLTGVLREGDRADSLRAWLDALGDCASDACLTILQTRLTVRAGPAAPLTPIQDADIQGEAAPPREVAELGSLAI